MEEEGKRNIKGKIIKKNGRKEENEGEKRKEKGRKNEG